MNIKKVIGGLSKKYPGKNIVLNTPDNPTEIICEVDWSPEESMAVAVIDKAIPHVHRKMTEKYEVIKGKLKVHLDSRVETLNKGDKLIIKPNTIYWAEGDETCIKVWAKPGWTIKDHILVRGIID